jgi:hypothetical protein
VRGLGRSSSGRGAGLPYSHRGQFQKSRARNRRSLGAHLLVNAGRQVSRRKPSKPCPRPIGLGMAQKLVGTELRSWFCAATPLAIPLTAAASARDPLSSATFWSAASSMAVMRTRLRSAAAVGHFETKSDRGSCLDGSSLDRISAVGMRHRARLRIQEGESPKAWDVRPDPNSGRSVRNGSPERRIGVIENEGCIVTYCRDQEARKP